MSAMKEFPLSYRRLSPLVVRDEKCGYHVDSASLSLSEEMETVNVLLLIACYQAEIMKFLAY